MCRLSSIGGRFPRFAGVAMQYSHSLEHYVGNARPQRAQIGFEKCRARLRDDRMDLQRVATSPRKERCPQQRAHGAGEGVRGLCIERERQNRIRNWRVGCAYTRQREQVFCILGQGLDAEGKGGNDATGAFADLFAQIVGNRFDPLQFALCTQVVQRMAVAIRFAAVALAE